MAIELIALAVIVPTLLLAPVLARWLDGTQVGRPRARDVSPKRRAR